MQLRDRQIDLRVGKAFDAPSPEKALDEVRQCLVHVGAEDRFAALVAGKLPLSLIADVDLLISLYGVKGPLSIWRILSVDDCGSVPVDAPVPRVPDSSWAGRRRAQCGQFQTFDILLRFVSNPLAPTFLTRVFFLDIFLIRHSSKNWRWTPTTLRKWSAY
jgi:hypothetical protein